MKNMGVKSFYFTYFIHYFIADYLVKTQLQKIVSKTE